MTPNGFASGAAIRTGVAPDAIARALQACGRMGEKDWMARSTAARRLVAENYSLANVTQSLIELYNDAVAFRNHRNVDRQRRTT